MHDSNIIRNTYSFNLKTNPKVARLIFLLNIFRAFDVLASMILAPAHLGLLEKENSMLMNGYLCMVPYVWRWPHVDSTTSCLWHAGAIHMVNVM